jgi:short subunit dehydrogenase-like uncharacterized protein
MALPTPFAQVRDQFKSAQQNNLLPGQFSMRDFAQVMAQASQDPMQQQAYSGIADDNLLTHALKRGSAAINDAIQYTGLDQGAADVGRYVAENFGVKNTEYVADMASHFPRTVLDMAPMMAGGFVPKAAGMLMGATAGLAGSGALEASDSYFDASIAAATPWAATKVFGLTGKLGMQALGKIPGANKLGLMGGELVEETIERGGQKVTEQVLKAVTAPDRIANYLSGQVGAGATFLGVDIARMGEDALTPEHLLGSALMNAAFLPFDVVGLVRPHDIAGTRKEIRRESKTPEEFSKEPTAAQAARNKFFEDFSKKPTDVNKLLLSRERGLDIAQEFLNIKAREEMQVQTEASRAKLDSDFADNLDLLRKAGALPATVKIETLLDNPKLAQDPVLRKTVEDYKKGKEDLAKVEAKIGAADTETLFGVAIEKLGLDPAGEFLTTPWDVRTAELYKKQFGGKLAEEQIAELWATHQKQRGLEQLDMTAFPNWKAPVVEQAQTPKEKKAKAKKATKAKKEAENAAAGVVKPPVEAPEVPVDVDATTKSFIRQAVAKSEPGADAKAIIEFMDPKLAAEPNFEALITEVVSEMPGRAYDPMSGKIISTETDPITATMAAAGEQTVVNKSAPDTSVVQGDIAEAIATGATAEEPVIASVAKAKAAAAKANSKIGGKKTQARGEKAKKVAEVKKKNSELTQEEKDALDLDSEKKLTTLKTEIKSLGSELMDSFNILGAVPEAQAKRQAELVYQMVNKMKEYIYETIRVWSRKSGLIRIDDTTIRGLLQQSHDEARQQFIQSVEERLGPEILAQEQGLRQAMQAELAATPDTNRAHILIKAKFTDAVAKLYATKGVTLEVRNKINAVVNENGLTYAEAKNSILKFVADNNIPTAEKGYSEFLTAEGVTHAEWIQSVAGFERQSMSTIRTPDGVLSKLFSFVPGNLRTQQTEMGGRTYETKDLKPGRVFFSEEALANVVDPVILGQNLSVKEKRRMSPDDWSERSDILTARATKQMAGEEVVKGLLPLDEGNEGFAFLVEKLGKDMSLFETPQHANAIIDGVRQFRNLFLKDEKGVSGLDKMLSNQMRSQGINLSEDKNVQMNLARTFYNWVHKPKHWYKDVKSTVKLDTVEFTAADGTPLTEQAEKIVKGFVANTFEAIAKEKAAEGKQAKTEGVSVAKLHEQLKFLNNNEALVSLTGPVKFNIKYGELRTPYERAELLTQQFRTTINNAAKGNWVPEKLFVRGKEIEFMVDPVDQSSVALDAPALMQDHLNELKLLNPNYGFYIQTKPKKKTASEQRIKELIAEQPGLTREDRAKYLANPELWWGVKKVVGKDQKVSYEYLAWQVMKSQSERVESASELLESHLSDNLNPDVISDVSGYVEPENRDLDAGGQDKEAGEKTDKGLVINTTPRELVYDKELQKGVRLMQELKDSDSVRATGELKLLSELAEDYFFGNMSSDQKHVFTEAIMMGKKAVVEAMINASKFAPEKKAAMLKSYGVMKEQHDIIKNTHFDLVKDGKPTQIGDQVFDMLVGFDMVPSDIMAVLKQAPPELRALLVKAHSQWRQNEGNPKVVLNELRQGIAGRVRNLRQMETYGAKPSKAEWEAAFFAEQMKSLADLVQGRRTEAVEVGDMIVARTEDELASPFQKYMKGRTKLVWSKKLERFAKKHVEVQQAIKNLETVPLDQRNILEGSDGKVTAEPGTRDVLNLPPVLHESMALYLSKEEMLEYARLSGDNTLDNIAQRRKLTAEEKRENPDLKDREPLLNAQDKARLQELKEAAATERKRRIALAERLPLAAATQLQLAIRDRQTMFDEMVAPEVVAERIFDELGIPPEEQQAHISTLAHIVEQSGLDNVGFGQLIDDMSMGIYGLADSRARNIYLAAPEMFKSLATKDRARAMQFVTAHELGHIIEADARNGKLGRLAQEAYYKADDWLQKANPETLQATMDVFVDGVLPKEFKTLPALELSKDMRPEEFFANVSAMHQLSLLKKPDTMAWQMMPAALRNVFDWFAGHLHKVVQAAKLFKAARGDFANYREAAGLMKNLEAIRKNAREAEQNLATVERMFSYDPQNYPTLKSSLLEFVDPAVLDAPGAKDWVQLASGQRLGYAGDTMKTVGHQVSRLLEKGEDLAFRFTEYLPIFAQMRDFTYGVNRSIAQAIMPIYGQQRIDGGVHVVDAEWSRIDKSTEATEALRLVSQDADMRSMDVLTFDENTRNFIFNESAMSERARSQMNKLTPEQRSDVINYYKKQRLAYLESNKQVVQQEHTANTFTLAKFISALPSFAEGNPKGLGHKDARNIAHGLYMAMQQGVTQEVYSNVQHFNDVDFTAVLKFADGLLGRAKTLEENFAKNPEYLTFRRFKPVFIEVERLEQGKVRRVAKDFNTAAEADKFLESAKSGGWRETKRQINTGPRKMDLNRNSAEFKLLQDKENSLRALLDEMPIADDAKDAIRSKLGFVSELTKAANAEGYGFGTKRKYVEGFEDQNPRLQFLEYVKRSQRIAHTRVLDAATNFMFADPALNETPLTKKQFEDMLENFRSPDSEFGRMIGKANAVWFIGFNIPSHMVELMQPISTLLPEWVAQGGGYMDFARNMKSIEGQLGKVYAKAGTARIKGLKGGTELRDENTLSRYFDNPEEQALIQEAVNRGRIGYGTMEEVFDKAGEQHVKLMDVLENKKTGIAGLVTKPIHWYAQTSMKVYGMFTRHNELTGLLMGHKVAKQQGLKGADAIEFALNFSTVVNKSGGRAGRQATPYSGNKLVGHLFFALQGYVTGWFSQMARYYMHGYKDHAGVMPVNKQAAQKAFKTMLLAQFAAAGALGMPFMGTLLTLLEKFTDEDIKGQMFQALDEVTGDPLISNLASHGMASSMMKGMGFPIDLHSRFAMGGMLGFNEYTGFTPASLMGPTGSMVEGMWNMGKTIASEGDVFAGMEKGGPAWSRKMLEMVRNEGKVSIGGAGSVELEGINKYLYAAGFGNTEVNKLRAMSRMADQATLADKKKVNAAVGRLQAVLGSNPQVANMRLREEAMKLLPDDLPSHEMGPMLQQTMKELLDALGGNEAKKRLPADMRQGANSRVARGVARTAQAIGTTLPTRSKVAEYQVMDSVFEQFGVPGPSRRYRQAAQEDAMMQQNPMMFRSQLP